MTKYKLRGTESDRTGDVHLWITRDDQPLDLEEIVEDLMEQQREMERLRGELFECLQLLSIAEDAWDCGAWNSPIAMQQLYLTRDWYEAARKVTNEYDD